MPNQKLQCDLVMRGGITSGIVYPRAIAKLAETYDFRSIGGTSAGAIAAAGTAAAAYGAKHGQDHFQTRLKNLPGELATLKDGKSVLERLFQPQETTEALFRVLMAGLGRESMPSKVGRIVAALCGNYPLFALGGAAIALIPLVAFASTSALSGRLILLFLIVALIPAALFIVGGSRRRRAPRCYRRTAKERLWPLRRLAQHDAGRSRRAAVDRLAASILPRRR